MLGDHVRCVLDGVTRLLVRAREFEDVGCEHVSDVVRPVRQQPLDGAASSVGIVNPIPLRDQPPSLIEGGLS